MEELTAQEALDKLFDIAFMYCDVENEAEVMEANRVLQHYVNNKREPLSLTDYGLGDIIEPGKVEITD